MDAKTFFKHKQFYKHDEKTCIMVDNDINLPSSAGASAPLPYKCSDCSVPMSDAKAFLKHKVLHKHDEKTCVMTENDAAVAATSTPRRKTLIATRLRLHQQNAALQGRGDVESSDALNVSGSEGSNEIQLVHDRDAFKVGI